MICIYVLKIMPFSETGGIKCKGLCGKIAQTQRPLHELRDRKFSAYLFIIQSNYANSSSVLTVLYLRTQLDEVIVLRYQTHVVARQQKNIMEW